VNLDGHAGGIVSGITLFLLRNHNAILLPLSTQRSFQPDGAGGSAVVVIGSGPAGAAAAAALVESGAEVIVVEAGREEDAGGLTARIGGVTVFRRHRSLMQRSDGLVVAGDPATVVYEDVAPGGLTNHWSCAVPRFSEDDFRDGQRAGEAYTWPLTYADLAPWYDWVEPYLRIAGASSGPPQLPAGRVARATALPAFWREVDSVARRHGQAVVPVPYVYGGQTSVTASGTIFNSFVRMIRPLQQAGRLRVRFGARAIQLEWSGDRKRVTAVIARDAASGAEVRVPCRAAVVAAGTVNSTKLLLQSTSADFPHGLGNTHGVLGRYLHDHPLGKVVLDCDRAVPFQPAAYITRQTLDDTVPLYAASCLQWSGVFRLARSVVQGHPGSLASTGFSVFGTMAPSPDNYVGVDSARTASDGTPAVVLGIRYPQESIAALESARDRLIALLADAKVQSRVDVWHIEPVGGAHHFAGSCRMHASPQYGMLDAWNRLHAVPNVVVADSAAFTTGSEKNPVLTAMALAARAGRRLAEDLRTGTI
jgi:glucoside 3-dehydrogenase (cytochrome c) catalytic subunit